MVLQLCEYIDTLEKTLELYDNKYPIMYHMLNQYAEQQMELAENCTSPAIRIFYCATVAKIGKVINNENFKKWSHSFLLTFLDAEILPNGCCRECVLYDSLEWHTLILLMIHHAFAYRTFDYFHHKTRFGTTLQQAIYFIIPYVRGQKIHIMHVRPYNIQNKQLPARWYKNNAKQVFDKYRRYDEHIQLIYEQFYK